jgi:hypothetical protein
MHMPYSDSKKIAKGLPEKRKILWIFVKIVENQTLNFEKALLSQPLGYY